jgi:hypothetical protein
MTMNADYSFNWSLNYQYLFNGAVLPQRIIIQLKEYQVSNLSVCYRKMEN